METATIIAYALQALDIIPKLLALGRDVQGFVTTTTETIKKAQLENRAISKEEWDASNNVRDMLHAEFQKPQ